MNANPESRTKQASFDISDLARVDRVHVSLYTEPSIFEEEMKRIFYTTWVFVGHESEVKNIGDYKTTYIGHMPVIVTRDGNNEMRVLMNRCLHRGATLCAREKGNAKSFQCPYHGWEYALDGRLVAVGMPRGYNPGELNIAELGLARAPRVASYRGFVFASMNPSGISLSEHLGAAKPYLDAYVDQSPAGEIIVGQSGVNRHSYRGNWKIQVEGSVEGYHALITHATAMEVMMRQMEFPQNFQHQQVESLDLGHGHSLLQIYSFPEAIVEKRYSRAYIDSLIARLGRERAYRCLGDRWNLVIFPNLSIQEYHLREIRPVSVDQTEVFLHHTLLKDAPEEVNRRRVHEHEFFYGPASFGSPDDIAVFNRIQEGYQARNVPWVLFNRGYQSETVTADGIRRGGHTQETPQRASYYEYRRLMADRDAREAAQ
jgi:phenylpropionate dioxygenase-like ring-hydroxylating dioxygenase large terminal subunit